MVHCRTIEHVANLCGVSASELRKLARKLARAERPAHREGGEYYKQVALSNGRMYSLFDGRTEYVIGQEMREATRQNHGGGYYVYRSAQEARDASIPRDSELRDCLTRAIIRCQCSGSYCTYDDKLAFSRIIPLEIVCTFSAMRPVN